MAPQDDPKRVITPRARLSYPFVFKPRKPSDGGEAKYTCALVFEEGSDLRPVMAAVVAAAEEAFPGKGKNLLKTGVLKKPIRDDWQSKSYPENSRFVNVSSNNPIGIVGPYADPNDPEGRPYVITDEKELYPGCDVVASLRAFYYNRNGNKGIGLAINALQKVGDNERFDNRVDARDEFEALSRPTASLADLETNDEAETGGKADDLDDLLS